MDVKHSLRNLKLTYIFLTIILICSQFYLLSFKLPFDLAFSNKNVGFFTIYASKLGKLPSLSVPLLGFVLAHIALQSLLTFVIYRIVKKSSVVFPKLQTNIFLWGILFWLGIQIIIYTWNAYLFPYSFFAIKLAFLTRYPTITLIFLIAATVSLIAFVCLLTYRKFVTHRLPLVVIAALLVCLLLLNYVFQHLYQPKHFAQHQQPNVIIVIADSLRPAYAAPRAPLPKDPYRIEHLTAKSAFFDNAFSVLGRSSPGLVSILTGNYPKTSGAQFNLIPTSYINLKNALTYLLKEQGYQTIFLGDGRQFINLDKNYGFDQIIAAKGGIYDFIFSLINDTPLSNLIINTRLGAILFPYNYGNRNSYYNYLPNTFIKLVDRRLVNQDAKKPAFIVATLTVAHWPYVWARQPKFATLPERYENSVEVLDQQFSQLMQLFQKRGLLTNSLIVVLSDHGDSLGLPGDRIIRTDTYIGPKNLLALIPRAPYNTKRNPSQELIGIDTSAGHGTDLLSLTQLHTTLAFYYPNKIYPKILTERVALIDVAPTLLDWLNIKSNVQFDGISLKPLMLGNAYPAIFNRPIFLESEIDIPLIDVTKQQHGAIASLIQQYADLYDINLLTQQLILKGTAIKHLMQEKQLGVLENDWLLAYFPGKNALSTTLLNNNSPDLKNCYYTFPARKTNGQVTELFCYRLQPTLPYFVLVNLKTQQWQILFTNQVNENVVFAKLLAKLRLFYPGMSFN